MTRGAPRIFCVLLLTILCSGFEAAFAAASHADHSMAHQQPVAGGDSESAEHDDHCCHMAAQLVGIISELRVPDLSGRPDIGSRLRFLRLGVRAPPPVPPPTV